APPSRAGSPAGRPSRRAASRQRGSGAKRRGFGPSAYSAGEVSAPATIFACKALKIKLTDGVGRHSWVAHLAPRGCSRARREARGSRRGGASCDPAHAGCQGGRSRCTLAGWEPTPHRRAGFGGQVSSSWPLPRRERRRVAKAWVLATGGGGVHPCLVLFAWGMISIASIICPGTWALPNGGRCGVRRWLRPAPG